jgi:SAM-dependent methyltransferase
MSQKNVEYYDQIAKDYNDLQINSPFHIEMREQVAKLFHSIIEKGTILDFGGGTGLDLKWLNEKKYTIYFCEPSKEMRTLAIDYNKHISSNNIFFIEGPKTNFETWDKELPFETKMDAVLANFAVLNCIENVELLFKNMSLIIKPGGHVIALILDNSLKTLVKSYFKNTLRSIIFQKPIITYARHNGHQHIAYIHSTKMIKKVSKKYFNFAEQKFLGGFGFSLIHLTKK